ncbi:MAG: hypothetical protein M5U19_22525 [Microthrixaceae bacterium]|nr:hypothetical protein [Microthrixaceae bacterium]
MTRRARHDWTGRESRRGWESEGEPTMRMYRKFAIAGVMFGAIAMAPGTARADGSQYPSGAPAVQVGVPTFGNTSVPSTGPSQDYFRLPTLLEQSRVTVAAASSSSSGGYIRLAGNVDNYNWNQHKCNLADEQWFNHNGSRLRFDAAFATSSAYLPRTPQLQW